MLRELRLGRVDLYGDSYGSWFSQVFASRYPGQLRSVTLDSTYQVLGLDPWYATTVITARRAFDAACGAGRPARAAAARPAPGPGSRALAAAAGPRAGDAARPPGGRDRGQAHRDRADAGQPGQQRGLRPGRLPRPGRRGAGAAAATTTRRRCCGWPRCRSGFDDTNYPLPEFSDGLYFAVALHRLRAAVQPDGPARRSGPREYRPRCAASLPDLRAVHVAPVDRHGPVHRGLQRVPELAVADAPGPADHPPAAAGPCPAAGPDPVRRPRLAHPAAARRARWSPGRWAGRRGWWRSPT